MRYKWFACGPAIPYSVAPLKPEITYPSGTRLSSLPSVLLRCWLGGRKGIWPVKKQWWDAGVVMCLCQGADLHMAQLMLLPLMSLAAVNPDWFYLLGFTFLVPADPGSSGQNPRGP